VLEQSVPEGLYPMERTHAGAVLEELQPIGNNHIENCLPWVGPHAGVEEPRKEEGAAERSCSELTANLIVHPPVPLRGRNVGVKLSPGRREDGEMFLVLFLFLTIPLYFLIGNKSN